MHWCSQKCDLFSNLSYLTKIIVNGYNFNRSDSSFLCLNEWIKLCRSCWGEVILSLTLLFSYSIEKSFNLFDITVQFSNRDSHELKIWQTVIWRDLASFTYEKVIDSSLHKDVNGCSYEHIFTALYLQITQ